jgi:hypothetical protein
VGAGPGALPQVNVYDSATGALKFSFLAYNASFSGGVRVAVGDVNHDGTPDIITGAGPGGGPQVNLYDGTTGHLIRSFYGITPSSFTGGIYVAAGDVNGDGFADIIVGADAGGGPQVDVWDGRSGALIDVFNAFPATFTGGVRVGAGDVNGDGHADIIAGAGAGGGPQVTVFNGVTLGVLQNYYAFPAFFTGGVFVAAVDVNGDGRADVVVGAGAGGGPQVDIYSGAGNGVLLSAFFDPRQGGLANPSPAPGIHVGTTRVNGKARLLTAPGAGLPALVDVYDGATLGLLNSFFAFDSAFRGGAFIGG